MVSNGKKLFLSVTEAGDEAYLYAKRGLPVVVAERRCEGLKLLPKNCDVLILDDAFQHLAIERDFDIVLLTGKELKERVLPFGRLREPLEVLEYKGDYCLLTGGENRQLEEFCSRLNKPYGYLNLVGFKFLLNGRREVDLETLKGKKLGLISAVGDNEKFKRQMETLLKEHDLFLEKIYQFRDHYDYSGFYPERDYIWITTHKDFTKLEGRGTFLVVDRLFKLPQDLKDAILKKVKGPKH